MSASGEGAESAGDPPRLIEIIPSPPLLVWDITYACPLRCVHCYSESGRRRSRQLSADGLARVAEAIVAGRPRAVVISGGEPLMVKGLLPVMARMRDAGITTILYTSGWLDPGLVMDDLLRFASGIVVSLDGADAAVHDRIRGRPGAFTRAVRALGEFDAAVAEARRHGRPAPELGIDTVVMRSNRHQIVSICTEIAPRFPALDTLSFGAVIPTGLASRTSFAEAELIGDAEALAMLDASFLATLQVLAPRWVRVSVTDIRKFQMHPDLIATGMDIPPLQIEPDGRVRAMPIYEGTVGSLLDDPLERLWARAIDRWSDNFVIGQLRAAGTMLDWARATRAIDRRFGTVADRARITRRPDYAAAVLSGEAAGPEQ